MLVLRSLWNIVSMVANNGLACLRQMAVVLTILLFPQEGFGIALHCANMKDTSNQLVKVISEVKVMYDNDCIYLTEY